MTDAFLIFNPTAGKTTAQRDVMEIAAGLRSSGWSVRLWEPTSGEETTEIARRAAQKKKDVLLIAGGDGSIESAVAGLNGSRTALGILPFGTSNVFAQEIGIPVPGITGRSIVDTSLAYLRQAVAREVDLGLCNGIPFLLWAGIGLDGFIVNSLEPRRRWEKRLGPPYFAARAAVRARSYRGQTLRIQTGQGIIEGQFLLAVVSNIRLYAGGIATLSPRARMDDGVMELWLFSGEGLYDALRHAGNLVVGRHVRSEQVQCHPVRQAVLESTEPLYLQLDGDPFEGGLQAQLEVIPQGLRVLVPREASPDLFSE